MFTALVRIAVVATCVTVGNQLAGLAGLIIGAALGTLVITQTEDVFRTVQCAWTAGGACFRLAWRMLRGILANLSVRRFACRAIYALFVGAATGIGNEFCGKVWAVVASALAVAIGQAFNLRHHDSHSNAETPQMDPQPHA